MWKQNLIIHRKYQIAAKINIIKIITVIRKRRNIQELYQTIQGGTNESTV